MKNSYLFFILFYFLCLNEGFSQNKDTVPKKRKIEKPILMGFDVTNKILPNTISLKVKIVSGNKSVKDCNNKKTDATAFKIIEFLGNGQGVKNTFNNNTTEIFIVPLHLKERLKKKKEYSFTIYVKEELCFEPLNKLYSVTKIF